MRACRTREKIEKFCDTSNFLFAVDKGVKKLLHSNRRYAPAKKKKFDDDRKVSPTAAKMPHPMPMPNLSRGLVVVL